MIYIYIWLWVQIPMKIPFLVGWTSINPSNFWVRYQGFDPSPHEVWNQQGLSGLDTKYGLDIPPLIFSFQCRAPLVNHYLSRILRVYLLGALLYISYSLDSAWFRMFHQNRLNLQTSRWCFIRIIKIYMDSTHKIYSESKSVVKYH